MTGTSLFCVVYTFRVFFARIKATSCLISSSVSGTPSTWMVPSFASVSSILISEILRWISGSSVLPSKKSMDVSYKSASSFTASSEGRRYPDS